LGHAAVLGAELATPVETGIVEGPDHVAGAADQHQRAVGDVVDEGVADLGDVLLPAGDLPDPRPELLDLEVVPGPGEIAVTGNVPGPEVDRRLEAQRLGDGHVLLVEEVLDRRPGRAVERAATGFLDPGHRRTSKPAATRSHVAPVTPRSRRTNFCTRPVGVRGRSSSTSR